MKENKTSTEGVPHNAWRMRMHEIIFEADTLFGKLFDIFLIVAILLSIVAVLFESVDEVALRWGTELKVVEWFFTILFTIEYTLRFISVQRPLRYARSFFGIVDFLSIIPTYMALIFSGAHIFLVVRSLRLLRVFRVLKLIRYVSEGGALLKALKTSIPKITVFLFSVITIVLIVGSLMHMLEGDLNAQFRNIPRSIYWAIVTITTVGYGNIVPQTIFGEMIASVLMIIGYGIIAVPTGIVTVELTKTTRRQVSTQSCPSCSREGHDTEAIYCKFCGSKMNY